MGAGNVSIADLECSYRPTFAGRSHSVYRALVNPSGLISTVEIHAWITGSADELRAYWDKHRQVVATVLASFHIF